MKVASRKVALPGPRAAPYRWAVSVGGQRPGSWLLGGLVQHRRAAFGLVVFMLVPAVLSAACSKGLDTGEVSARSGEYGAKLATSTTIDRVQAILGGRSRAAGSGAQRADVAQQLLDEIARNPEFAEQLKNLTPEQLSEMTGLSVEQLNDLGITPATVASLGDALVATRGTAGDPDRNDASLALLGAASGAISQEAVEALRDADPAALAAVYGASTKVDPSVTRPLGAWLKLVDPNGLGRYSEDESALALMAVLLGAQLDRDPIPLDRFGDLPPDLQYALRGITNLADRITPQVVKELNRLTTILGPNTFKAIGWALRALDRPEVAEIVSKAVDDPFTFGSILASAVLLIPGLAETMAPETFDTSQKRIEILGRIFVVSLLRLDPLGMQTFLESIGVEVPPDFWQTIPTVP